MAILNVKTESAGLAGVKPRMIYIDTNDSFATITAADFLKDLSNMGYPLQPTDMALVTYGTNSCQLFRVLVSGGVTTLIPQGESVETVVTPNHIAVFTTTEGVLGDDVATAINGGNLQAGLSGTAGTLASFPATAAKGSLVVQAANNTGDFITKISNAAHGQATTYTISDAGVASGSLLVNALANADVNANVVHFIASVDQSALAAAGSVTILASSGAKEYRFVDLFFNFGGTNFSGVGGDRDATISDGTSSYSVIPAASLQAITNARWGSATLPFPTAVGINKPTAPGASVTIAYSGGTTDYTAGSVVISGVAVRTA